MALNQRLLFIQLPHIVSTLLFLKTSLQYLCSTILVLLLLVNPSVASEQFTIEQISIIGNKKTLDATILQETSIKIGQSANQKQLEDSAQGIRDLGLFREVEVTSTPINNNIERRHVTFTVKEKSYNFVLPKLDRSGDGDITTGVVWKSSNLNGKNQQSKLTLAYTDYETNGRDKGKTIRWEFEYPRIIGTPYSFQFGIEHETVGVSASLGDESAEYNRDQSRANFMIGRWFFDEKRNNSSHGLRLSGGLFWENYDHELIEGNVFLFDNPNIFGVQAQAEYINVENRIFSRSGEHFRYRTNVADSATGSDIDFIEHHVFYRRYIPLDYAEHTNLNYQISFGTINRSRLGLLPEFEIGGSSQLRGYRGENVEGNTFAILNVEALTPIFNKETVRGALLFDVGNAWESFDEVELDDWRVGIGVGLRWKLTKFVRTDLRADIVHGVSKDGETRIYLSSNNTF